MKKSILPFIVAIVSLFVFSSCKVGHAINEFNDSCPIVLTHGIKITKAESKGNFTNVEVTVVVNSSVWDTSGLTPSEWTEFKAAIIELAVKHDAYRTLVNQLGESGAKVSLKFSYE